MLKKDQIEKRNQRIHTKAEREILGNMDSPFIVQLHFAFQNEEKLYLVMDFMRGGSKASLLYFQNTVNFN